MVVNVPLHVVRDLPQLWLNLSIIKLNKSDELEEGEQLSYSGEQELQS